MGANIFFLSSVITRLCLFSFLFFSCSSSESVYLASSKMQVKQRLLCSCTTNACRRLRIKLLEEQALPFIKNKDDTLFFMESVGLADGRPVGRVWTRHGTANYSYDPNAKQFDFKTKPFYNHHIYLVEKFDSASLNAERKLLKTDGYGIASGYRVITATRVMGIGRQRRCESFRFIEVINPKRDF